MKRTNINKGKVLLGVMLLAVIVQVFSLHLHFWRVGQSQIVFVQSSLSAEHNLIEEASSAHGEVGDFDLIGWLGQKLAACDLPLMLCFVLILPVLMQLRPARVDVHRLSWSFRLFFSPPLRAPPL